ncbi:flagellar basal body rod protein [Bacillus carboniphilus]|uniref:Flagellar basal body rod protein n=1 Tax=Bacillus carboniphilus TaxID=86663 RepID=A0ABY9JST6_9BACI|nr:flagellar basal body rod protein [Bacillus carboniphilus]WLR42457.1 flagellar basal body rod protein [Bacillus carboniphilus]
MKKVGLLIIGGIATFVLVGSIGPLISLAISLVILYFVTKEFLKTNSMTVKVALFIIGLVLVSITLSNFPALVGVFVAYVLYVIYKKWNEEKLDHHSNETNDPFTNFEKQWAELNK